MIDEPAKLDEPTAFGAGDASQGDGPPTEAAPSEVTPGAENPSATVAPETDTPETETSEAIETPETEVLADETPTDESTAAVMAGEVAAEAGEAAASEADGDLDGELDGELDDDLDGEPEPEPEVAPAGPVELVEEEDEEIKKDWYILKVQSNRERSIAAALQRKVAIEGIEHLFGQILVPTEKVTEFKAGKKKVVERKLWPGYIAVEMHVNDDTWFAIRETSGIGDFTGSGGAPTPMSAHEIAKILHTDEEETDDAPKLDIKFKIGDRVKVKDGNFESFEGDVATIDEASGKVSVMISIFGRSTPVELEYWQVETL